MNLSTLITDVRSRLDGDTATFWSDAQITAWLNEANRDLALKLENLQAIDTQNIVASQENYDLPTDYLKIVRVQWDAVPLAFVTFGSLNRWESQGNPTTGKTGTPSCYYLWNNDVYLYPVPSASLTDGLVLWYIKSPAELVNTTDTPEHPEFFHHLLTIYACHAGLVRDQMYVDAERLLREYMDGVDKAREYYAVSQRSEMTMVRYVNE